MAGSWFGILESARLLGSKFTALDLKNATEITELKLASAWLSKFLKWGYVAKLGTQEGGGKKPFTVYSLTDYGKSVAPKASHRKRLEHLLAAVDSYFETPAKPDAEKALRQLVTEIKKGLEAEDKARAKGRS